MATAMVRTDQRRLRRSSTVAGVGDGIVAVALPLLAASITRDPLAVAAVLAVQHFPWVVVAAGWHHLRTDRRTLLGLVDTTRAVALGLLGFVTLIGQETILGIQLTAFVVGLGEALTDGAETETEDVSGLSTRGMLGLALVGLPLGGLLYEVYPATPFLFEVLAFAVAAVLVLLVRGALGRPSLLDDGDELPRLPTAAPVALAATAAAALASGAASAVLGVLVLFALQDLGLGAPAFGFLLTGLALCAAAGAFVAPEVGRALGVKLGLVLAFLLAGAGHASASQVADPEAPWLAAIALGVAAGAATMGGVLVRAMIQLHSGRPLAGPALPPFHLAVWSSIPVGALAGGWVARTTGVQDLLLWVGSAWFAAAVAAAVARPAKNSPEIV